MPSTNPRTVPQTRRDRAAIPVRHRVRIAWTRGATPESMNDDRAALRARRKSVRISFAILAPDPTP
jgi:hypothetical protein